MGRPGIPLCDQLPRLARCHAPPRRPGARGQTRRVSWRLLRRGDGRHLAGELRRHPRRPARARGVEVLNAGAVACGPPLYELRLRDLLLREGLRVDEFYVFIDISDVLDELFYEGFRPRPAGGWRDDRLSGRPVPQASLLPLVAGSALPPPGRAQRSGPGGRYGVLGRLARAQGADHR